MDDEATRHHAHEDGSHDKSLILSEASSLFQLVVDLLTLFLASTSHINYYFNP